MKTFITVSEFARLASTTTRTIQWYSKKGVINPAKINSKGFRLYEQKQVLEYQAILLLSTLGISLSEIQKVRKSKSGIYKLFNLKKSQIQKEINLLQFNLDNLDKYIRNLKVNGTMVDPKIHFFKPFNLFYIEKSASYVDIDKYAKEIISMLSGPKTDMTTLTIFYSTNYRPQKSRLRVGVLTKKSIKIKKQFIKDVQLMKFNPGKTMTYRYRGNLSLLSLFWKELEKYCKLKNIKIDKNRPDFEIYRKVCKDETKQFTDIYLPIK